MASSILLDNNDIAAVYVDAKKVTLPGWLESTPAKRLRKPCDYLDDKLKKRVIDNDVRTCNRFINVNVAFRDIIHIQGLVSPHFKGYKSVQLSNPVMLEYPTGGFFESHTDTKRSKNHIGNALLLPPKSMVEYTGGTLLADDKKFTASKEKWRLVILPMGTEHRITKVNSGKRIVLKFGIIGVGKIVKKTAPQRKPKPRQYSGGRKD